MLCFCLTWFARPGTRACPPSAGIGERRTGDVRGLDGRSPPRNGVEASVRWRLIPATSTCNEPRRANHRWFLCDAAARSIIPETVVQPLAKHSRTTRSDGGGVRRSCRGALPRAAADVPGRAAPGPRGEAIRFVLGPGILSGLLSLRGTNRLQYHGDLDTALEDLHHEQHVLPMFPDEAGHVHTYGPSLRIPVG